MSRDARNWHETMLTGLYDAQADDRAWSKPPQGTGHAPNPDTERNGAL